MCPCDHKTNEKTRIPYTVDDEGTLGRIYSGRYIVPVTNEHIRREPNEFPENKHHEQVAGYDNAQHREGEKTEHGKIAADICIMGHIPG